jgi:hypothetical protein
MTDRTSRIKELEDPAERKMRQRAKKYLRLFLTQQKVAGRAGDIWLLNHAHHGLPVSRLGTNVTLKDTLSETEGFSLQHQRLFLAYSLTMCAFEIAALVVYGVNQSEITRPVTWMTHDQSITFFWLRLALSFIFLASWLAEVVFTRVILSMMTFLFAVTAGYQLVVACVAIGVHGVTGMYVPFFLRVWGLRSSILRCFGILMRERTGVSAGKITIIREIFHQITWMLAILTTCAGIYRLSGIFLGGTDTLFGSIYLMVVSFTTVGYGDITPGNRLSRLCIILSVFAAAAALPPFLGQLAVLGEALGRQRRFRSTAKHVVVAGNPTYKEILTILHEITRMSRRRCVVFLSRVPFNSRALRLKVDPEYRDRVDFFVGEVTKRKNLLRCNVPEAEAIFLLSDKHAKYNRGDFATMKDSVFLSRFDRQLPQYLWLRRDRHSSLLPNIFASFHHMRLTKVVSGIALTHPLVIPILVNLIRTTPPVFLPDDLFTSLKRSDDWPSLYQYSRAQIFREIPVRGQLVGLHFRHAALLLQKQYHTLPIGVCREGSVLLNPCAECILRPLDLLFVITSDASSRVTEGIQPTVQKIPKETKNEPVSEQPPPAYMRRRRPSVRYANQHAEEYEKNEYTFPSLRNGNEDPPEPVRRSSELVRMEELQGTWCSPLQPSFDFDVKVAMRNNIFHPLTYEEYEGADTKPKRNIFVLESTSAAEERRSLEEDDDSTSYREHIVSLMIALSRFAPPLIARSGELLPRRSNSVCEPMSFAFNVTVRQSSVHLGDGPSNDVLSRLVPLEKTLAKWKDVGKAPVRHFHFSGLRSEGLAAAEVTKATSLYVGNSVEGDRMYKDAPLISVNSRIQAFCIDKDEPCPPIVTEVFTFTSCNNLLPRHRDPHWLRSGEDDFQSTLSFMTGAVISHDMFLPVLFQTFHSKHLAKVLDELLRLDLFRSRKFHDDLETQEQHAREWRGGRVTKPSNSPFSFAERPSFPVRFGAISNECPRFLTFRDATKSLLLQANVIPIAVGRLMPKDAAMTLVRYPITNPVPTLPLKVDDYIYFVR